jgi:nucleolar protein 4
VTTEELTEHFSQSYPIRHAVAVLDPATKQCKGFGFVTFADAEDAQRAVEEFNGTKFKGQKIKVELAESRHRDGEKGSAPSAVAEAKAAREEKKKEKREDQQPPKLIIRNLPWSIKTPEELSVLFRSFGKVKFATIPKQKTGLQPGFGFVTMRGRKNAEKALEAINGKEVDGRTLAVDWAVEQSTWQTLQEGAKLDAAESGEKAEDAEDADSDGDDVEGDGSAHPDEDEDDFDDEFDENEEDPDEHFEPIKPKEDTTTLFIRNLPFSASDDALREHFTRFGAVRYARIVLDQATERPRGTGFVSFYNSEDADNVLKNLPKINLTKDVKSKKDGSTITITHSVLQDSSADPTGSYTMDGRLLQISRAVDRVSANRLATESAASRFNRDKDKRKLYLLSEGTIASNSPLYASLSPSEIAMREASATQRRKLIESNPSLHLSLTRLAIRNIPRSITSKDLKALARQAVVGFATDVKEGKRTRLSKEELARGGAGMREAELERKRKGAGVVKQAKVVFESTDGGKVAESTGAGRSRGYGFIEYYTHRSALMGLRWLNGHAVDYRTMVKIAKGKNKKDEVEANQDRKKRLIVEFAIENAQIVVRRNEREQKAKGKGGEVREDRAPRQGGRDGKERGDRFRKEADDKRGGQKRKRDDGDAGVEHKPRRNGLSYEENAKRFKKGRGGTGEAHATDANATPKKRVDKPAEPVKGAFGMQRKRMQKRQKRG